MSDRALDEPVEAIAATRRAARRGDFDAASGGRIGRDERVGVESAHGGIATDGGALSHRFMVYPPRT